MDVYTFCQNAQQTESQCRTVVATFIRRAIKVSKRMRRKASPRSIASPTFNITITGGRRLKNLTGSPRNISSAPLAELSTKKYTAALNLLGLEHNNKENNGLLP
ncbi:hypothetical protein KCP69_12350 [Salmonella enterica subsp. enterica]|nr:hypothetical protein KCP69_12350 [Salmonella enterica subsp. enterica]